MIVKFYGAFYKFILTRRYKVTITGIDLLKAKGAKLILPNHQSHIDPQIIAVETLKYAEIVPVIGERFFKIPIIKFFLKKWDAIPVSDFKRGNRDPNALKTIFSEVIKAFHKEKTVIIYPSGQLQEMGLEKIKNKQCAHAVVSGLSDSTRVIGLRIKGLWGSSFSYAWNGKFPAFLPTLLKGIAYFFSNLVFLCPRRNVSLEFVDITEEAKKKSLNERHTFNAFLEEFYNKKGIEQPTYIKHFFFFPKSKRKLPESIKKKYDKIKKTSLKV